MKKTLSIIFALCLILSMAVFMVNAESTSTAEIGHGLQTVVNASKPRESVTFSLRNVNAQNEIKVELWSGETKLSTTVYREYDLDDATTKLYPKVSDEMTVNIVISGVESGSWDTTWHVAPTTANIPDAIKVYVDGGAEPIDTYYHEGGAFLDNGNSEYAAEKAEYLALEGVTKPATIINEAGEKSYMTVDEAFKAAVAGDEVQINVAGTYTLSTSSKDITITGTVDGVVFDNIGAKNMGGANVTFNNVTFDYYPNVTYTGLQHSGNLVYNNCTINGQVFLYGASETFNECTFNQNSADAYNVWTYGAKVVNFNECTFNSVGKSVLVYNEGACATTLNVTDCDFIASAPVDGKAAIEIDTTLMPDGTDIVIDDKTTATGFAAGSVSGETLWNDKKDQTDLTVTVAGYIVWPKAIAVKYVTIPECEFGTITTDVDKAYEGETVTVTVVANKYYKVGTIFVNGNPIEGNTFEMPAEGAVITVEFIEIPTYDIIVTDSKNGKVSLKQNFEAADEIVTLNITPNPGYKLKEISVVDEYGYPVTVGGTSFKMPDCDVYVTVTYEVDYSRPVWATFYGSAEAGETVTLTSASDIAYGVQTVVADAKGNYSFSAVKFLTGGTYTFTVEHGETVETVVVTVTDVKDQLYASVTGSKADVSIERDIKTWSKLLAIAD